MKEKDIVKNFVGKPLQTLSYTDKVAQDNLWGKGTIQFMIDNARFGNLRTDKEVKFITKSQLYDAYNNKFPDGLFDYTANPFASNEVKYTRFPAKIRNYNILRPNVDLFIGEWHKRPFAYDVVNLDGDDAFNSFLYEKEATYKNNLSQRFVNTLNKMGGNTGQESQDIPDPKTVITNLNLDYKDAKALDGYKALKSLQTDLNLDEVWRRLLKDWIIAGDMYTLKIPLKGDIYYVSLDTSNVDCVFNSTSPYAEDGEQAIARFPMTVSEIVDHFYDLLGSTKEERKKNIDQLELTQGVTYTNKGFIDTNTLKGTTLTNKRNVYYCCWVSKKLIGFLTYPDPLTGEEQYDIVDEDYVPDVEIGEEVEWMWVNEAWQGWAIEKGAGDYLYLDIKPIEAQRNELNSFSSCKLPINGKLFSATQSDNVSPLLLGMPYQLMYIVIMYRLELTIARSKGKVLLMDYNTIPDELGEIGFFWYGEATGFAPIDRTQNDDVDRSWNQYTVVDFSLFKDIKQLIDIANYYKESWDELLGITRQRKGQTTSSDGLGTTEQAIFRSSIISEVIFAEFESFIQKELQGLLDLTKFAWVDGKKGYYRNSDGRLEMFAIDPEDYINSSLGIFVENISTKIDRIAILRQQINAIAQRKDVKLSTIVDLAMTDSITEMKAMLKRVEAVEQDIATRQAQSEHDRAIEIEKIQKDHEVFTKMLEVHAMHEKENRLDNREYIKAELEKLKESPDTQGIFAELEKTANDRLERLNKFSIERAKLNNEKIWQSIERESIKSKERIAKDSNRTKLKNKVAGEK